MDNSEFTQRVRNYWNERAALGGKAGSDDLVAKQLEINAIAAHVRDGMRVLDIGCGNGISALELATRFKVDVLGIDYAAEMVEQARQLAGGGQLRGSVRFATGDVLDLSGIGGGFDLVYTERTLINLPDFPAQARAIGNIAETIVAGGAYAMCENSHDGLDRINELRQHAGLKAISPPWHNRYFRDAELRDLRVPGLRLERVEYYSSTYYFLSRVVNAWVAQSAGEDPRYDSPINQLALHLPPMGELGQGRIWLWRKEPG